MGVHIMIRHVIYDVAKVLLYLAPVIYVILSYTAVWARVYLGGWRVCSAHLAGDGESNNLSYEGL